MQRSGIMIILAVLILPTGCEDPADVPADPDVRLMIFPGHFRMNSDIEPASPNFRWNDFQNVSVASSESAGLLAEWRGQLRFCAFQITDGNVVNSRCTESTSVSSTHLFGGRRIARLLDKTPFPFVPDWAPLSEWSADRWVWDRLNYVHSSEGSVADELTSVASPSQTETVIGVYAEMDFEGEDQVLGVNPFGLVLEHR